MPFSRYQIRNEYSLADPEVYNTADKDDPEALLEGVAMAGLVGVLRQLGDLAEFAAEIFHDLHEEVMATASRGHGLLLRVQQLESEFPSIERAFLSQTCHSAFFPNPGIDWHPNRQTEKNLITSRDLPRFVMDSYEECRGPPRLFLLDKFDVAGVGACLKRYTDPSFYKVEASSYEMASAETQRDKKTPKTKKKGSQWKGGETPEVSQPSHVKLHQLFLEERVQTGAIEPERRVKLKRRPNKFPFDSENGKGYMEKLLNSPSEDKLVHEVPVRSSLLWLPSNNSNGSSLEILDGIMVGSATESRSPCVEKIVCADSTDSRSERWTSELPTSSMGFGSTLHDEVDEKHIEVDGQIIADGLQDGYRSDDVASETDNYVDALATMESELETDLEYRSKTDRSINQEMYSDAKIEQIQSQLSDSQSTSDGGNGSVRKGIHSFSYSDTTSISAENTSPVGVESPPQPFACTEIPFRPRVSHNQVATAKKIQENQHPDHQISNDTSIWSAIDAALPVDRVAILEESKSKAADLNKISSSDGENLSSPRKTEEHQLDVEVAFDYTAKPSNILSPGDNQSSPSSVRDPEGEADSEHSNDLSSPTTHLPNTLETTYKISENSSSKVSEAEYAEDNHSISAVDSQCSSPHAVLSHVDEHPLGLSMADLDIRDADVTPSDDIPLAEEKTTDNPDTCSLPEGQLKETGEDILHIFHSAEARVSDSNGDETEPNNSEIKLVTGAISKHADADRNGGHGRSVFKVETELEEREIESVNLETKDVSVLDDFDGSEGMGRFIPEDDTEFEGRESDSVNSETETSVAALPTVDYDKNEDDGLSTIRKSDESEPVIKQSVIYPVLGYVPCDTASYDSSSLLLPDCNPNPSANSKILQDQSHSILEEMDQNGMQSVSLHDLGSQSGNTAPSDQPDSTLFTEDDHDFESKYLDDNIDKFEAEQSSPLENKVDKPTDQLHVQSLLGSRGSQLDYPSHADHATHIGTHSEPYSVNLASQCIVQEDDLQKDPMNVVVATHESTNLQDLQSSPESFLVPVAEKPPMLEIPQASSHEVNLSDQVKHSSTPAFSGFGMLPQGAPINMEEMPPLPPLPPMQWRMRKLQNAPLTPNTDGDQHSVDHFPPIFPPQVVGHPHPSLDANRYPSYPVGQPDTETQKSKHAYEDPTGGTGSSSQTLLPESSLHTVEHNSSASSEVKFAENFVAQKAVEIEQPHSVSTSDHEIFWPSSSSSLLPPIDDQRPNSIRPMKIHRPRSPLIDAVAAHDKSKLRKVIERAAPQVLKEEETDTLLEQIRTKSFNLKPAIQTRPSIQGPKTNLRVAAILEKANAIRQAFAGSDDDDSDNWSDS